MGPDDIFTDAELDALTPQERAETLREMQELEANGLAADGTAMHLGDEDWYGGMWEPQPNDT